MKAILSILLSTAALAGCASMTAVPLNANGSQADGPPGLRYYVPKPYVIVAEVPVEKSTSEAPGAASRFVSRSHVTTPSHGTQTPANNSDSKADTDSGDKSSDTAPAAAGDTSFGLATKQYSIKLIYLPDYAQPMALNVTGGLFGSASFKPVLQDGWMLGSVDTTVDNTKLPDAISSVASLFGSDATGGTKAATKEAAGTMALMLTNAGQPLNEKQTEALAQLQTDPILRPGLYALPYYDKEAKTMHPACAVAYFTVTGLAKGDAGCR